MLFFVAPQNSLPSQHRRIEWQQNLIKRHSIRAKCLDFTLCSKISNCVLTQTMQTSSTMASTSTIPSPSCARRRALLQADEGNQTKLFDGYPLSKYIAIAHQSFRYFQRSVQELKLDEAYVYGMRFVQLALTNLPKHRGWNTLGPETRTDLTSKVTKVLSRLEIIKQRMDEEEITKLRARMMTRVEDEMQRQEAYRRQQEEYHMLQKMEAMKDSNDKTFANSIQKKVGIESRGGKATKKLRKLFRFSKSSKKASKQTPFESPVQYGSAPAVPSIDVIRHTRDQQHMQARMQPRPTSYVVPRYTIEEKPVVEEVTLKLHPMETRSRSHVQYDHSMDEKDQEENNAAIPSIVDGQRITPVPHGSTDLSADISLDEILQEEFDDTKKQLNFVKEDTKPSLTRCNMGEEERRSFDKLGDRRDDVTYITVLEEEINDEQELEEKSFQSYSIIERTLTDGDVCSDNNFDTAIATQEQKTSKCISSPIHKFDDFLAKGELVYGNDNMTYITIEEDIGMEKEIGERRSNPCESVMEETLADEDVYVDYNETETSVEIRPKVEDNNASELVVNSPACVMSPMVQSEDQRLKNYPSINLTSSIDHDTMTCITLDTFLEKIDTNDKAPLEDECKERIMKIIRKDLWKHDIEIVTGALEELNDSAKSMGNSRATIVQYGGLMAIIRTMIGFQKEEVVQYLCCNILRLLAADPQIKSLINDLDVIPLVSSSMIAHPKSQRIQKAARDFVSEVEFVYS